MLHPIHGAGSGGYEPLGQRTLLKEVHHYEKSGTLKPWPSSRSLFGSSVVRMRSQSPAPASSLQMLPLEPQAKTTSFFHKVLVVNVLLW